MDFGSIVTGVALPLSLRPQLIKNGFFTKCSAWFSARVILTFGKSKHPFPEFTSPLRAFVLRSDLWDGVFPVAINFTLPSPSPTVNNPGPFAFFFSFKNYFKGVAGLNGDGSQIFNPPRGSWKFPSSSLEVSEVLEFEAIPGRFRLASGTIERPRP